MDCDINYCPHCGCGDLQEEDGHTYCGCCSAEFSVVFFADGGQY